METGGSTVEDRPQTHSQFHTILGYVRHSLQETNRKPVVIVGVNVLILQFETEAWQKVLLFPVPFEFWQ